jgi:hypothetical protein
MASNQNQGRGGTLGAVPVMIGIAEDAETIVTRAAPEMVGIAETTTTTMTMVTRPVIVVGR